MAILKTKKAKRWSIGAVGIAVIGIGVLVVGSGFSGCATFSITPEEANERFTRRGHEPPEFITQETNPGTIHLASVGEGDSAIVFVHGSPGSWSAFSGFLMNRDLQKLGRVIDH